MRGSLFAAALTLALATSSVAGELWRFPRSASDRASLRVEPPSSVVRLGDSVTLNLAGSAAAAAQCDKPLQVESPKQPGVVDVRCESGAHEAVGQITFTDAGVLPWTDPYSGVVALFKLRDTPENAWDPAGRQKLGARSLDALLAQLGAHAFPAFPFDRSETRDSAILARWVAVSIPAGVNAYQAVSLLRANEALYAESYLPVTADVLRTGEDAGWATPLRVPRARDRGMAVVPSVETVAYARAEPDALTLSLGADQVWSRGDGRYIGIGVVDSGVDVGHPALAHSLRTKPLDRAGTDADQNGVLDGTGGAFAHLAIVDGPGGPRLALGAADVEDWTGRGTAIAGLAARQAPGAWILAVDVQENRLRPDAGEPFDPRLLPTDAVEPLQTSTWSLAQGVVYAVAEGSRVVTCAWPAARPHWILYDAFIYAEQNCALAVCAAEPGADAAGYPAGWRIAQQRESGGGSGPAYDAWSGRELPDYLRRPLSNVLLATPPGSEALRPDLVFPSSEDAERVKSAAPRRLERDGEAEYGGAVLSAGVIAGSAALIASRRPDLPPVVLAEALSVGFAPGVDLSQRLPTAFTHALEQPKGSCRREGSKPIERRERAIWKRLKVKTSHERQAVDDVYVPEPAEDPPASPDAP